jgi:transport family protein 27
MEPNANPYTKHKTLTVLRCKLVIVGDPCVGKTALTQVFVNGSGAYPKNYLMTVGAEFTIKQIPIDDTNVVVELYIYDSAGQSIFNQVEMNSKYVSESVCSAVEVNV